LATVEVRRNSQINFSPNKVDSRIKKNKKRGEIDYTAQHILIFFKERREEKVSFFFPS
jgi:hypothetical protein